MMSKVLINKRSFRTKTTPVHWYLHGNNIFYNFCDTITILHKINYKKPLFAMYIYSGKFSLFSHFFTIPQANIFCPTETRQRICVLD